MPNQEKLANFLEHYGVKGMKWGVERSGGETSSKRTEVVTSVNGKAGSGDTLVKEESAAGGMAGGFVEEEDLTDEEIEERERQAAMLLGIDIDKFKEYTGDKTLYAKHLKGAEWTDDRGSIMYKAADRLAKLTGDDRPALQRNVENHVAAKKFMQNIFDKPSRYQDKRVTINFDPNKSESGRDIVNEVLRGGGELVLTNNDDD